MDFEEFLLALDEKQLLDYMQSYTPGSVFSEAAHKRLVERLLHYFIVGGLPEVVKTFCDQQASFFTAFENVRAKQNDLITTYLGDIAKHSGKVNAMHILRVLQAVPAQLAATHDASAPKFTFKDVIPGVDRYSRLVNAIDWLEAAKLVLKVPITNAGHLPFMAHTSESTFKLFLFDIGLLGAMAKIPPDVILKYDYGSYKGYFAENYVAQSLSTAGIPLYSWQEKRAEVEFLLEQDGKALPLEVKSGFVTKSQSAKLFAEKYHSPYRIILSLHNFSSNPSIKYFPLYWAARVDTFL
jgi:predicted AAA+ superfamily ATPase